MILGDQRGDQIAQLGTLSLSDPGTVLRFYAELSALERAGVVIASTFVLGVVVLGLLPEYSRRTVRTARASPVISVFIGAPGALTLLVLVYVGQRLSQIDVGVFFGIPFLTVGLVLIPVWTLLGVVTLGECVGSRLGRDDLVTGLILGALLVGGLSAVPQTAIVIALSTCLGVGAGMRVLVTGGIATDPSERTVPPANRV